MSEKKNDGYDWEEHKHIHCSTDGYRDYWKALFTAIKGVGEAKAERLKHLKKKAK